MSKYILAAGGVLLLLAVAIGFLYLTPLSYLYCLSREGAWLESKNKDELEGELMAFYSTKTISPQESMWGRDHVLAPDQRMTQYMIFGKEPLDVVYNHDGSIDTIYTSYE